MTPDTPGPRTPTGALEPGTLDPERDTDMTATYVKVVVVETVIIIGLWVVGQMFS